MEIIVIAAVAQNNIIGKQGDIPWRLKEDFLRFKKLTTGHPCVMTDVTYESLPDNSRPLPNRENIVCSFNKDYKAKGATVFFSFDEAIEYCRKNNEEQIFITGGSSFYKLGMKVADRLELTRLHKDYEGDVTFPEVDYCQWKEVSKIDTEGMDTINNQTVRYSFVTYKRK